MMTYALGWGNSKCVRQAFLETYCGELIVLSHNTLMDFDYPNCDGELELLKHTKEVIKRQTGQEYKHVFLTNGATGAINIALKAYYQKGYNKCHTRTAPYYLKYPVIIKNNHFQHLDEKEYISRHESVILLDLPSNPLALTTNIDSGFEIPTIIDGVYLNNVYLKRIPIIPKHDIMIGSYSKLTGINGMRVGWIATKKAILGDRIKDLVMSEYCGLSSSGSFILNKILRNFNWDQFESRAKLYLDYNRTALSKLEKYFGDTPVPQDGMFWFFPLDKKARNLLSKANISWASGKDLGTSEDFARLNVGASVETINEAVKAILKEDKI